MKNLISFLTLIFLLQALSPDAAFAIDANKTLEKLQKKYNLSCSQEKMKRPKCRNLSKKIQRLKKTIAKAEDQREQLKTEVWKLTNEEREKEGLALLQVSALLEASAQAHADDMSAKNYIAHESLEGATVLDRITSTGYLIPFETCQCSSSYEVGENIAKGQPSPKEVVEGWMTSEGHRKNILKPSFTEIGIGLSSRGSEYYWVQNFGTIKLNR